MLTEPSIPQEQFNLGMIYYRGVEKPRNFVEVAKWWRKAAEQGHSDAQYGLGCAYQDGTGVQKDSLEAVRWFRLSAAQGNSSAQFNLGLAYWLGVGVPHSSGEAVKNFRQAGEQGHSGAQVILGRAYARGQGVPMDIMESIKWLQMAAAQGDPDAQIGLVCIFGNGEGVPQNLIEAYKWVILATQASMRVSNRLNNVLEQGRSVLINKMTSSQMDEAQRLASVEVLKIKDKQSHVCQVMEFDRQRKAIQAAIARDNAPVKAVSRERQSRAGVPSQVRREVWRRDGGACVKCGSRRNLEYDHIVPVSKGGSNTARNIELLCESCNRSKSNQIQ